MCLYINADYKIKLKVILLRVKIRASQLNGIGYVRKDV